MTINGYEDFNFLVEYWDSAANPRYYVRLTVRVQNQCYAQTYTSFVAVVTTPQSVYAGATLTLSNII